MNAMITAVAMDALKQAWQLGFGTPMPRRNPRPVNRRTR